ncbi:MAG: type II toxin-antitoxin system HipA family toxin [Labilithrix sp.]|nr:type II toxin-antitoxin system HipA family toxin [Labilithrix sp.]
MTPTRARARFLDVRLGDTLSGYLCEIDQACRFVPADGYRGDRDRPTLSLSITIPGDEDVTSAILDNPFHPALYNTGGALPPYFAGLLPEGELLKRLEQTRTHPEDRTSFGVLAAAGLDLPGALEVTPSDAETLPESVRRAVASPPGGAPPEIAPVEGDTEGAASISGVQNKLALSTAHAGRRYTMPTRGHPSDLIAKLPAKNDDSQIWNEYVSMQLAAAAGVDTASCRPMPLSTVDVEGLAEALGPDLHFLAVDRFDRLPDRRVHAEDGCQVLTRMPNRKYGRAGDFLALVQLLARFGVKGVADVRQFFVRQAVNTLLGNSDAHLKNVSFVYPDGVRPALSPAYDIVCVAALPGFAAFKQNVAIDADQRAQTLATYRELARATKLPDRIVTAAVKDTVALARSRWPALLEELDAPPAVKAVVLERLDALPLARV